MKDYVYIGNILKQLRFQPYQRKSKLKCNYNKNISEQALRKLFGWYKIWIIWLNNHTKPNLKRLVFYQLAILIIL